MFYTVSNQTEKPETTNREAGMTVRYRKKKVRLELTVDEARILRKIMLFFRNEALAAGFPTEDIDGLILKLSR